MTREVVCAVVVNNGNVLLVQRGEQQSMPGKWEFPGGKCEAGESYANALKRELQEELEMEIAIVRPLTTVVYAYPDFTIRLIPFLCTSPDNPVLHEHRQYAWVNPGDAVSYDLTAADIPVLLEWQQLQGA